MIIDKQLEFDPAGTAITASAASTNVIDLHGSGLIPAAAGKPGRDMGVGTAPGAVPRLMISIQQTFGSGGGSATLNIQFQGAPDNGSGSPGSYTTYAESGAIPQASLVAGNRVFDIDVPRVLVTPLTPATLPRFLRLNYVVASGPMTAGTIQAEIVLSRDDQVSYQAGVTVAN